VPSDLSANAAAAQVLLGPVAPPLSVKPLLVLSTPLPGNGTATVNFTYSPGAMPQPFAWALRGVVEHPTPFPSVCLSDLRPSPFPTVGLSDLRPSLFPSVCVRESARWHECPSVV
jgi:hypothetical protein